MRFDTMPVSSGQIRAETTRDPVLREVVKCILHGWPSRVSEEIKPFFCRKLELSLYQVCIMLGMRVVVPQKYQRFVLDELHQGHPGVVRTKELA